MGRGKFGPGFLLVIVLLCFSIRPVSAGKLAELAPSDYSQEPSEPAQSSNNADYQINLPWIVTPIDERPSLMALYNSTGGDAWTNNTGWNTDDPYCGWYGVTCDAVLHVISLSLGYNFLTGTIPPELGNLVNLMSVDLSGNNLSGPIPAVIGNLVSLTELKLDNNGDFYCTHCDGSGLSGTIPAEIGDLVNLQTLDLSFNYLSGPIPAEIGNLVNLNTLSLTWNYLTTFPSEIGNIWKTC